MIKLKKDLNLNALWHCMPLITSCYNNPCQHGQLTEIYPAWQYETSPCLREHFEILVFIRPSFRDSRQLIAQSNSRLTNTVRQICEVPRPLANCYSRSNFNVWESTMDYNHLMLIICRETRFNTSFWNGRSSTNLSRAQWICQKWMCNK